MTFEADDAAPSGNEAAETEAAATATARMTFAAFIAENGLTVTGPHDCYTGTGTAEPTRHAADLDAFMGALPKQDETCQDPMESDSWHAFPGAEAQAAIDAAVEAGRIAFVEPVSENGSEYLVFADVVAATSRHDEGEEAIRLRPFKRAEPGDEDASEIDFINMTDDPYFGDDTPDEPFHIVGDTDDMTQVIADIVMTSTGIPEHANVVRILSQSEEEPAEMHYGESDDWGGLDDQADDRDTKLFECVLDAFRPSGFEYQYNDGAHDRVSGFYQSRRGFEVEIDVQPPSSTLRAVAKVRRAKAVAEARTRLVAWLRSIKTSDSLIGEVEAAKRQEATA